MQGRRGRAGLAGSITDSKELEAIGGQYRRQLPDVAARPEALGNIREVELEEELVDLLEDRGACCVPQLTHDSPLARSAIELEHIHLAAGAEGRQDMLAVRGLRAAQQVVQGVDWL